MPKYAESFLLDLGRVEKFEIVSVNETVTVKGLTFAFDRRNYRNKEKVWFIFAKFC